MKTNSDRMMSKLEYAGYGVGQAGQAIQTTVFNSFMLLFLTTVIKIPAPAVGAMILISRIIDAFSDLGFSLIGDRTKTKLGSYRPWLIFAAIPSGICIGLFFGMPDAIASNLESVTIWMWVFFILFTSVFITINFTSLGAYGILASPMLRDRRMLGILRQWGMQLGGVALYLFGMKLILKFSGGSGLPTAQGFASMGWFMGNSRQGQDRFCAPS